MKQIYPLKFTEETINSNYKEGTKVYIIYNHSFNLIESIWSDKSFARDAVELYEQENADTGKYFAVYSIIERELDKLRK